MRISLSIMVCSAVALSIVAGCNGAGEKPRPGPAGRDRYLFSVDFQPDKPLRYKFVSRREMLVDFGAAGGGQASTGSQVQQANEQMELVMAYRPVEIGPLGFATIEARCESVKVHRVSISGKRSSTDAVTTAAGKSFRLKVTPSGLLEDRSQLEQLIKELGQAAFVGDKRGAVKDQDMVYDFVATQWFLWDSVSSIKRPARGVAVGDTWQSRLLVPLPVPMRVGRNVVYSLEDVRDSETGRRAVIRSLFTLAERPEAGWPVAYSGSFQMRGMFGFFRGYEVLSLSGGGEEVFDLNAGVVVSDRQEYEVQMRMAMPGLGRQSAIGKLKPNLTVRQTITMELLEN